MFLTVNWLFYWFSFICFLISKFADFSRISNIFILINLPERVHVRRLLLQICFRIILVPKFSGAHKMLSIVIGECRRKIQITRRLSWVRRICKHNANWWLWVSLKILRSPKTNGADRYRGLYRLLLTTATKTCNLRSERNHY